MVGTTGLVMLWPNAIGALPTVAAYGEIAVPMGEAPIVEVPIVEVPIVELPTTNDPDN